MIKLIEFNGRSNGFSQIVCASEFDYVKKCFDPLERIIFYGLRGKKRIKKLDILVSNISDGIVMNLRTYDIFKKYKLPEHTITPIQVIDTTGDIWEDYIFFIMKPWCIETLDIVYLDKCQFVLQDRVMRYLKDLHFVRINEYFDFLPEIEKLYRTSCKKIVFKKDAKIIYDFFELLGLFNGLDPYISEELALNLKEQKITGFVLFDVDMPTEYNPLIYWE